MASARVLPRAGRHRREPDLPGARRRGGPTPSPAQRLDVRPESHVEPRARCLAKPLTPRPREPPLGSRRTRRAGTARPRPPSPAASPGPSAAPSSPSSSARKSRVAPVEEGQAVVHRLALDAARRAAAAHAAGTLEHDRVRPRARSSRAQRQARHSRADDEDVADPPPPARARSLRRPGRRGAGPAPPASRTARCPSPASARRRRRSTARTRRGSAARRSAMLLRRAARREGGRDAQGDRPRPALAGGLRRLLDRRVGAEVDETAAAHGEDDAGHEQPALVGIAGEHGGDHAGPAGRRSNGSRTSRRKPARQADAKCSWRTAEPARAPRRAHLPHQAGRTCSAGTATGRGGSSPRAAGPAVPAGRSRSPPGASRPGPCRPRSRDGTAGGRPRRRRGRGREGQQGVESGGPERRAPRPRRCPRSSSRATLPRRATRPAG